MTVMFLSEPTTSAVINQTLITDVPHKDNVHDEGLKLKHHHVPLLDDCCIMTEISTGNISL